MKKIFLLLLSALSFIACSSEPKEQIIEFQMGWAKDSGRGQAIQKIVDKYNEENSGGIKVETVSGDKLESTRLLTQVASGDAPDIMTINYSTVRAFASEGILMPIEGELKTLLGKAYPEAVLSKLQYDGSIYGVPWIGHSINLIYNKNIFEKAGLTEAPDTWDDVINYSKIIKEKTGVDGLGIAASQHYDTVWMSLPILYSYGLELFDGELGSGTEKISLNNEKDIASLQKLQEIYGLYINAVTANGGKVMEDFRGQNVAMEIQGPWGVTDIWKSGNPFVVETSLAPKGPNGRFIDIGIESLAISAKKFDDAKIEAINKFLTYMIDEAAQTMIMDGEYDEKDGKYYPFRVPIRQDLNKDVFFKQYPELVVFSDGVEYAADTAPAPYWSKIANEIWSPIMNELALKTITPEEAAKRIDELANPIIVEFYANK